MSKCLIVVSGISEEDYGLDTLKESELWNRFNDKYDDILEIKYQHILDKNAIIGKTILDPFRILNPFNFDAKKAEKYIQCEVDKLKDKYDKIDVLAHSMGCWLMKKVDLKAHCVYMVASPIGFIGFFGRSLVKMNIGRPKLRAFSAYYFNSKFDPVSCCLPNVNKERWRLGSMLCTHNEFNCSHNFLSYLNFMANL